MSQNLSTIRRGSFVSHRGERHPKSPALLKARRQEIWELAIGYSLILLVLWTPRPFQRPLYLLAAAFLIGASLHAGQTPTGLGLTSRNLLRSAPIVLLAGIVACLAVAWAAHSGTLHAPKDFQSLFRRYWGYVIWSMAQQFLLQDFFLLRLRRLLPGRNSLAVAAAAGIFSFAHLPNPVLTTFTLLWGSVACALFLRHRNLYSLGVAHAILGITVAVCLPPGVTHNMHVGLGYFRYGQSHPATLNLLRSAAILNAR